MKSLDEAIRHCEEVAEQNKVQADKWQDEGGAEWGKTITCRECAAEHRQLTEWLMEMKDLREENKVLMQECDRLIKEKGELLSKISGGDVRQLEEQLKDWKEEYANLNKISYGFYEELKEAKRLLRLAISDFSNMYDHVLDCDGMCDNCPIHGNRDTCDKWSYADEALKLIGDELCETDNRET